MATIDLFNGTKPRAKARVMMRVIDAGDAFAKFQCRKCGNVSGWMFCATRTDAKRGIPCEACPQQEPDQ